MSSNKKVLVHCYGGISRSATIVISYMMSLLKSELEFLSVDDLISSLQKIRSCVNPNHGFIKQLELLNS